jgi:GntR family transcriptional regulator
VVNLNHATTPVNSACLCCPLIHDVTTGYHVPVRRAEVVQRLRELIDSREPGDALPAERLLSEQIGVSRPTLRAAVDELARDGLLVRRHGQGTFTALRKISQEVPGAADEPVPPAEGDWTSEVLVDGIAAADFTTGSLYRHLRTRWGVVPADAVQTTEPTVTDATESRLLDVPLHAPALQFERVTRDVGGRVVEFTRSIYRGDRYRITTRLRFGPDSG